MNNLETYQNFYFVGIGGIGMSALARYFHASGKNVLGYDKTNTKLTQLLMSEGIDIVFEDVINEKITLLQKENTLVIYTPAIKKLGILDYFNENQFEILKRAKVLGLITDNTNCIAVAGTHGKTTTSTLVSHLCKEADLPFSCFLGGISENFKSNFLFNGTEFSVVEADEYDRSFLNLSPDWAVITSTDADHLDIYGDKNTIEEGFRQFAALVPEDQQLFVRKGIEIGRAHKTYAVNEEADYYSDNLRMDYDKIYFDFHAPASDRHSELVEEFVWDVPGIHNVENATVALAILHNLGVDFKTLKKAIANFKGIKRRYTKHIYPSGKIYIDDYAHHPTEINAVVGSIKTFYPDKKLLVVFQPHLFSRTRDFVDGFAESLSNSEELILLDIYPARELQENFEGITSDWLLEKVTLDKKEISNLSEAFDKIKNKEFDILLTVGAGNIDTLYDPICEWMSGNNN
ncbi:UDP-N-acetylmuramate--L-alanine ligase [Chryseobacterium sp. 09-1422]|uniref:UDP-N-acetylmuramate--L-alanine ligase n=1 Tax=Chryseobacterium kimseyorum TaxID=2984028 RepID=A0ABT3I0J0_9FLAO|nr:UDP-N-acetylmuramate--L-alanine ligase [Chryseobacterium kimseyorum]MCW3169460.1 UDP-N-acetylmuramate--L-alanine ligase [Chryseobacterium kimseyorum]